MCPYTRCSKSPNFQSRCVFSTPGKKSWSSVIKKGSRKAKGDSDLYASFLQYVLLHSCAGGMTTSHQPLVSTQNHHPCEYFSNWLHYMLHSRFTINFSRIFTWSSRSVGRISAGLPWCGWQDLSLPHSGREHQGLFDLLGEEGEKGLIPEVWKEG